MDRRSFDFLYAEICVAINRRVSRYELWLLVSERFDDPSTLPQDQRQAFFDDCIDAFLNTQKEGLSSRARKRLGRRLAEFDPRFPTPEEWLHRLSDASRS